MSSSAASSDFAPVTLPDASRVSFSLGVAIHWRSNPRRRFSSETMKGFRVPPSFAGRYQSSW